MRNTKKLIDNISLTLIVFGCVSGAKAASLLDDIKFESAVFITASFEHQYEGSPILEPGCTTHDNLYWGNGKNATICTGENPKAEFTAGVEFSLGDWRNNPWIPIFQLGIKHESQWFTGPPFNDEAEFHAEKVYIQIKLGGLR